MTNTKETINSTDKFLLDMISVIGRVATMTTDLADKKDTVVAENDKLRDQVQNLTIRNENLTRDVADYKKVLENARTQAIQRENTIARLMTKRNGKLKP